MRLAMMESAQNIARGHRGRAVRSTAFFLERLVEGCGGGSKSGLGRFSASSVGESGSDVLSASAIFSAAGSETVILFGGV